MTFSQFSSTHRRFLAAINLHRLRNLDARTRTTLIDHLDHFRRKTHWFHGRDSCWSRPNATEYSGRGAVSCISIRDVSGHVDEELYAKFGRYCLPSYFSYDHVSLPLFSTSPTSSHKLTSRLFVLAITPFALTSHLSDSLPP